MRNTAISRDKGGRESVTDTFYTFLFWNTSIFLLLICFQEQLFLLGVCRWLMNSFVNFQKLVSLTKSSPFLVRTTTVVHVLRLTTVVHVLWSTTVVHVLWSTIKLYTSFSEPHLYTFFGRPQFYTSFGQSLPKTQGCIIRLVTLDAPRWYNKVGYSRCTKVV